jgi:hypothetical protein
MIRVKMSAAWPGGNGTMKRTGRDGHAACALALVIQALEAMNGAAAPNVMARRRVTTFDIFPPGIVFLQLLWRRQS